jgi:hypothetical protein
LTHEARDPVLFSHAPAGVLRGQLGSALHRAAAARTNDRTNGTSVYEQLFRTPRAAVSIPDRPARILGPVGLAGDYVPHPFVLRLRDPTGHTAPVRVDPGDTMRWTLSLVGTGARHLPALTAVLDDLGTGGLGSRVLPSAGNGREPQRGRMDLKRADLELGRVSIRLYDGETWRLPADCGPSLHDRAANLFEPEPTRSDADNRVTSVHVRFETPVRLTHNGTALDAPPDLTAEALSQACYRRWAAMALCYGADPPSTERLDAAFETARALGQTTEIADRALVPARRTRYSARQDRRLSRTGLVGSLRLAGPPPRLETWRYWLRTVAPLHLGKSTSMGFGRITVSA